MSSRRLEEITSEQVQKLWKALWSWTGSAWERAPRLIKYLGYYKDVTASYDPDTDVDRAIQSHDGLFKIIEQLKVNSNIPRQQVVGHIFGNGSDGTTPPSTADANAALDIAVAILLMINCAPQRLSVRNLEKGLGRISWEREQTLSEFIAAAFPLTGASAPVSGTDDSGNDLKRTFTARQLMKHAGLKFKPTDDLRNHLRLNHERDVVEIFHHTAFLKEHLRLTKDKPHDMTVEDSLKCGALPRQLALETLDSIQRLLFPLSDPKSYNLLLSLISSSSFDPDCTNWEFSAIRGDDEKDISYRYFGARLADLYEALENPQPRNWVEKWAERKSGARYVMIATLTGVAIAIFLGILSLAVECYSAWVGYQQWQHPVGS